MKKIVIFGSSGLGQEVYFSLDKLKYEVVAFIDNASQLTLDMVKNDCVDNVIKNLPFAKGMMLDDLNRRGIYVLNPNQIVHLEYDLIIISVSMFDLEMRAQLLELGVEESKIMTFMPNSSEIQWSAPRYTMMRNCIRYIKERNIQGAAAELGVYQGDFASRINFFLPDREIYLFDTFEGFSDKDNNKKDVIFSGMDNFKDTSAEAVLNRMPNKEKVHIRKGWFPETAQDLEETFCFVSLDADLYAPIYNGLQYFYPRLSKGGFIFIHDFESFNWTGVKKAVYDFLNQNDASFVPLLGCSSAIITK